MCTAQKYTVHTKLLSTYVKHVLNTLNTLKQQLELDGLITSFLHEEVSETVLRYRKSAILLCLLFDFHLHAWIAQLLFFSQCLDINKERKV